MHYFRLNAAGVVDAVAERLTNAQRHDETWVCRADRWSRDEAQQIAWGASAVTGERHIVTDAGEHCSPRIDVVRCPAVGDPVSYAFNGDSYPDGEIVSVSETLGVIRTSTGNRYTRVKQTGGWRRNGTWWLISGHRNDRNPHI